MGPPEPRRGGSENAEKPCNDGVVATVAGETVSQAEGEQDEEVERVLGRFDDTRPAERAGGHGPRLSEPRFDDGIRMRGGPEATCDRPKNIYYRGDRNTDSAPEYGGQCECCLLAGTVGVPLIPHFVGKSHDVAGWAGTVAIGETKQLGFPQMAEPALLGCSSIVSPATLPSP